MTGMGGRRRILITGSTRGIGRATAERMAEDGEEIVLHGRRAAEVEAAVAALSGRAAAVSGDGATFRIARRCPASLPRRARSMSSSIAPASIARWPLPR